ncbi:Enoyl-CoA hydratase/isomerase [Candidatus Terasakiella magnetica]|uniref:Enoyl-CoA hydratase/isomerase n=1 Tax=Candidatus Terasakiella magnetica TaxID=1867952 RepID=A0A1C3RIR1_9PROT|nr:enoyl-CoA hydratase-related protein [Candidatus Terasakiella magnetica]SCA57155.1 Enoyl-CoA hydratase/isomerase [Candidatus Terasakiella magnetica]
MSDLPKLIDATLHVENRIATLTFDRHDVRNALTGTALIDDIINTIEWVNKAADDISVLIMTGAGSAFSAGGNIKDMKDRAGDFAGDVEECQTRYRQGIQRIPLAMNKCEVPIIAAVNGPAVGAGFDLANMADIRIASSKAKFGETFVNLGIIPGDGGAYFLQRLIGYQKAAELTFTGRVIDAAEAKEIGVVLDVVEPDALLKRATELASQMAAKPPQALRFTKRLMKMGQRMELPDFLDLCACFQGMCHNSDEHMEAVEKMLELMKK